MKQTIRVHIVNILLYLLSTLSFVWGGLLFAFSSRELVRSLRVGFDWVQIFFVLLGLGVVLYSIGYAKKIYKAQNGLLLLISFYTTNRKRVILALVLTALFSFLFSTIGGVIPYNSGFEIVLQIISIPWVVGSQIAFLLALNIRRFLPFFTSIHSFFDILIPFGFQVMVFYTLARMVFRKK